MYKGTKVQGYTAAATMRQRYKRDLNTPEATSPASFRFVSVVSTSRDVFKRRPAFAMWLIVLNLYALVHIAPKRPMAS